VGLDPPRDELARRIAARVDAMIAAGLIEEVRGLATAGIDLDRRAFDAIGYREARAHLRGELAAIEVPEAIKAATRRFARRQLAWFRSEPDVTWYKTPDAVDVDRLAAWLRAEGE
jgi:tRNA dimethylallyltransferase